MARVTKHDLKSAATRERLVAVARGLFAEQGYADVGTEQIVQAAGVTRGALYHQFRNKEDLFAAVAEAVEADVVTRVAAELATSAADPGERLIAGADAFLVACGRPEVQRILHEAPTVLGATAWRELSGRYGLGLVRSALRSAIEAGAVTAQPVDPLAHLIMGALEEAARYIAAAPDAAEARRQCLRPLRQLFDGLRRLPAEPRPDTGAPPAEPWRDAGAPPAEDGAPD